MNYDDRRQFQRLPKTFRIELAEFAFPLNSQEVFEVQCADISAGGLRFQCNRTFEVGDKVTVKIYIPSFNKYHPGFLKVFESDSGQYLQAIAEVSWVEQGVQSWYGLKFLDVDSDDWAGLCKLIDKEINSKES